ncbi:MAG: hypothetical protein MR051_03670 [Lentisphaeria bacterium]|nr:hypothetical protein [Lentisphaeria bacterium]
MTDTEKQEIAELAAAAVSRALAQAPAPCQLGIDDATARELISFAETWRTCRKVMLTGVIATAIGGLLTALWSGIRTALRH